MQRFHRADHRLRATQLQLALDVAVWILRPPQAAQRFYPEGQRPQPRLLAHWHLVLEVPVGLVLRLPQVLGDLADSFHQAGRCQPLVLPP